jgi:hypothetical protein
MAWTTPRTWVVGEVVTAAQLNTHLRDNINNVSRIFYTNTSSVFIQNTTATTEIFGYTLPAGLLGLSGAIRVQCLSRIANSTGGGQTISFQLNFGGVGGWSTSMTKGTDTADSPHWWEFVLQNRGSASSQYLGGWMGPFTGGQAQTYGTDSSDLNNPQTRHFQNSGLAVNTAGAVSINAYVTLGTASSSFWFNKDVVLIELLPSPLLGPT